MAPSCEPVLDEDLTPRFHWRWNEHGLYLAVCSVIGLFTLALYLWRPVPSPRSGVCVMELIHVRYLLAADEPPEREQPFRDTRVIQRPRRPAGEVARRSAM
jgi:hypothetical protein